MGIISYGTIQEVQLEPYLKHINKTLFKHSITFLGPLIRNKLPFVIKGNSARNFVNKLKIWICQKSDINSITTILS